MIWVASALAILFGGAVLCLLTIGRPAWARVFGPAVTVAGSLLALPSAIAALGGESLPALRLPWSMPFGSLTIGIDALSAVFAIPILCITALAAVYGSGYLHSCEGRKNVGLSWCFYNLLAGSMLLVVVAENALLFLLAWETMALSSFFLVMFESELGSVRRAGWTYLVATHIGTAFLLVLFTLLGREAAGSLDFHDFSMATVAPALAGTAFLLAVVGFGTKAGFIPLHVWLPEAHPAAPSHVSAVMSGVMIKTGIYGLVRILTFLGLPPPWWGWVLVGIGGVSGILGVLFALAQHDLKRLLAYCSVENIGIVALGLGVGLLGLSHGRPTVAFLGFAGALLHVINHAVFKSLLFMGAGSVLHATGTREIDRLGGLLKRMPITGLTFLIGSAAICGLPPLSGFVSEFMIYAASFRAMMPVGPSVDAQAACLISVGSLAFMGGLALACFAKAFGVVFLGEPRHSLATTPHEATPAMWIPMAILAAACVAIGLCGPLMPRLLAPAVAVATDDPGGLAADLAWTGAALRGMTLTASLLLLSALLVSARALILRGRPRAVAVTWDCGYVAPTPRMQYTASSFAEPIVKLFRSVLWTRRRFNPPSGFFPGSSSFSSETPDVYREHLYRPVLKAGERALARFRWLQHGRLNLYILCMVLALLALLIWKLR